MVGAAVCGAQGSWRGAEGVGGVPGGAEGPPEWAGEGLGPLEMRAGANGWAIEGLRAGTLFSPARGAGGRFPEPRSRVARPRFGESARYWVASRPGIPMWEGRKGEGQEGGVRAFRTL